MSRLADTYRDEARRRVDDLREIIRAVEARGECADDVRALLRAWSDHAERLEHVAAAFPDEHRPRRSEDDPD